jgi:KAP family P-loop domain
MDGATSDNSIWADDLLNRKPDADFLYTFLKKRSEQKASSREGSFVLNIDAEWGFGKTFFLDRFAADLKSKGHLVASVNAWKDDHADDPFVAILAAIDEAIKPYVKASSALAKGWTVAKNNAAPILARTVAGIGKTLVKKYVGEELSDLIQTADIDEDIKSGLETAIEKTSGQIDKIFDESAEKIIQDFSKRNKAAENFRLKLASALEALKNEKDLPLFIFVDELDRCRPSYAVALLERVKHLFDVPNIVFVFATNNDQLQHAIAGAYGPSFDGYRYLKRFFERSYTLHLPPPHDYTKALLNDIATEKLRAPKLAPQDFICFALEKYRCDLRAIKQVIDIIDTVISVWNTDTKIDLISLVVLSLQYVHTGKSSWNEAIGSIPSDFVIDFGKYRTRNFETSEHSAKISNMFKEISQTVSNLRNAIKLNDNYNINPEREYLNEVFLQEWNGRAAEGPSALYKLPELIKAAGNFVDEQNRISSKSRS